MWGILVALSLDVASAFSDFDVRERTGDYFLSTCTPFEQSYGMRLFEVGRAWAPTVVAPLALCPLGYAVADDVSVKPYEKKGLFGFFKK